MKCQCLNEGCGRLSFGHPVWKEDDKPTVVCSYCLGKVEVLEAEKTYVKKTKRERLEELTKEELVARLLRVEEKSGRRKREIRHLNRQLPLYKKLAVVLDRSLKVIQETSRDA